MSYILDAIKKSEAERNQGIAPGALAGSVVALKSATPVRAVALVLALNVAGIAGWWWWQNKHSDSVEVGPAAAEPPPTAPPPVAAARAAISLSRPATAPIPATSERPTIVTPNGLAKAPPPPSAGVHPDRMDAAPDFVPTDTTPTAPEFSTHVYADDPDLRAVTLDGRRLTEGDLIEPGMRLVEITENGVVVDYRGRRIAFDVLQDWRS